METGSTQGQPSGASNFGGGSTEGNDGLSQAFDKAIAEARKTLETTTVRGADLYALKQNAR